MPHTSDRSQPDRSQRNPQVSQGSGAGPHLPLNLSPEAWSWALWRIQPSLPEPEPQPFNLKAALKRLKRVKGKKVQDGRRQLYRWDWSRAEISIALSQEEANFWLMAMTCNVPGQGERKSLFTTQYLDDLVQFLAQQSFQSSPDLTTLAAGFCKNHSFANSQIVKPLHRLFSIIDIITRIHNFQEQEADYIPDDLHLYLDENSIQSCQNRLDCTREQALESLLRGLKPTARWSLDWLVQGFRQHLSLYLTASEREVMQKQLRPALKPSTRQRHLDQLAAYLGMPERIQPWLEMQPINDPEAQPRADEFLEIIFCADSAEAMEQAVRSRQLPLSQPKYILAWLAHTECSALDWVCHSILVQKPQHQKTSIQALIQALPAPDLVPCLLELWKGLKASNPASKLAYQWLVKGSDDVIATLFPIAAGIHGAPVKVEPSVMREAALELLKFRLVEGESERIQQLLEQADPNVVTAVRSLLFPAAPSQDASSGTTQPAASPSVSGSDPAPPSLRESPYPPLDASTTPDWLREGILALPQRQGNANAWPPLAELPLLLVEGHCLTAEQIQHCLWALQCSALEEPLLLVQSLKQHLDCQDLDAFVWQLYEHWLAINAPANERWMMGALGLLGGDATVIKLAALIKTWPASSKHRRAVFGLQCLRAIATDTALMQIHAIAQTVRFKGLKARAQQCLGEIASDLGLTPDQLADRIIPDCGLDARGQQTFDFGARQFQFVLTDELKPMVRDATGKLRANLPKPNQKDDPQKAEAAIADWRPLKKLVKSVVGIERDHLEQAMVRGRTWAPDEFQTRLVQHPLMTHLVQRLIWASCDAEGAVQRLFRVDESQGWIDARGESIVLPALARICLPHPLRISPKLQQQWQAQTSHQANHASISSLFPQLARDVYQLTPEERQRYEITRFESIELSGVGFRHVLRRFGWYLGEAQDNGAYYLHYKPFPEAGVTAVIGEYEGQRADATFCAEVEWMKGCLFLQGAQHTPVYYPKRLDRQSRREEQSREREQAGEGEQAACYPGCLRLGDVSAVVLSEVIREMTEVCQTAPNDGCTESSLLNIQR